MPFEDGEVIGQYRVESKLGHGGMATVYRAHHVALDRIVAIKALHAGLKSDPTFLQRFQREAQIIAKLEHPNIVPIYDFAEHKGEPYLVMKYIEGETLKERFSHDKPTFAEIGRLMKPVAEALTYAHDRGILHRDVKPSNILIDKQGIPYLADFGLARIMSAGESTLSKDMMLGTPQYVSPEQAQGEQDIDSSTDVYSLGVVLYELTVGRVPYMADTPYAILHNHIYSPLPLPSQRVPDFPKQVEEVLVRAMAKARADRYPSAAALGEAFLEAVATSADSRAFRTPFDMKAATPPTEGKSGSTARPSPTRALPKTEETPSAPSDSSISRRADTLATPQKAQSPVLLVVVGAAVTLIVVLAAALIISQRDNDAKIAVVTQGAMTQVALNIEMTLSVTHTPTVTPSATPTLTPTATNTYTPTATLTFTPTPTNTPTATKTDTPTYTPTDTLTFTPTATSTYTPTATLTVTPTPTITEATTATSLPTTTLPPQPLQPTPSGPGGGPGGKPGGPPPNPRPSGDTSLAEYSLQVPRVMGLTVQKALDYIASDPSTPEGYYALGVAYLLTKPAQLDKAKDAFESASDHVGDDAFEMWYIAYDLNAIPVTGAPQTTLQDIAANLNAQAYALGISDPRNGKLREEVGIQLFIYANAADGNNNNSTVLSQAASDTKNGYIYALSALASFYAEDAEETWIAEQLNHATDSAPISEVWLISGILAEKADKIDTARMFYQKAIKASFVPHWVEDEVRRRSGS